MNRLFAVLFTAIAIFAVEVTVAEYFVENTAMVCTLITTIAIELIGCLGWFVKYYG